MRPRVPLSAGIAAARAAGRLSRLTGAGGGTTLPGKLLSRLDPDAVDRLAARLPRGSVLVSATNGKTTTTAMLAGILAPRLRLAHNRAGANLLSGVASTLLESRGAELGLFEVDEAALPEVMERVRPRAVSLGNLFRDQLDRYGELEHVAQRWRRAVGSLDPAAWVIANADDPQVGDLARERERRLLFCIDDPRHASPTLQLAADSKLWLFCGTPYEYAAAYVGHLGDYRCPSCGHARPQPDVVAHELELDGLDGGLYNVYNALAAASLALALDVPLDEIVAGLERFSAAFGRFERIAIGERTLVILLVKNPAGANEAVRTLVAGGAPKLVLAALNDEIADGRDVSWIWDVDLEPLLAGLDRIVVSGSRAAELALRCKYGGFDAAAIEVEPDLSRALDRALEQTPRGGELIALPTYTAMLELQRIVADRGYARRYWERAA